ncbi:diguanylate cyclase [Sulfurimonas sp.]|nr:diguanylate cyclase [Sulfurimonas sp.]
MKRISFLNNCKLLSIPTLIIIIILSISFEYIDVILQERQDLQKQLHKEKVSFIKDKLSSMIVTKQKSTVAIALSIANDDRLADTIVDRNIKHDYYEELISKFKSNTFYKNIWIQIIDKDLNSIHRSWTNNSGINLKPLRDDLKRVLVTKKPHYSVSVDDYTLSIKGMVPVIKNGETVGVIEVISHFNSISKAMKKFDYNSVVIATKKETKKISHPFTNLFIDNYYVANFDAPKDLREYLKNRGVSNYFNESYVEDGDYLIVPYPIKDINGRKIAYYIMFTEIKNISSAHIDYFMFKWIAIGVMALMLFAILFSIYLFIVNTKQKEYYKNIIDASTNIVIIDSENGLTEVNSIFFDYFTEYKTISEFKSEHDCVCEFFSDTDGYLQKYMDDEHWIRYVFNNPTKDNKAKVVYLEQVYYFSVTASLVSKEENHYAVVLADITEQEKYKLELEKLTITDPLSGIHNRRYFQLKIDDEISRAKRYKHPLSLIILDIDHFKKVNDKYGHKVGDEVIIGYSQLIGSLLREEDSFCRIGGEEFIIILPHIDKSAAFKVAEKLRVSVEDSKKIIPITMSFGVVEYIMGEESESIFHRADTALYKAKESGRNRVKIG